MKKTKSEVIDALAAINAAKADIEKLRKIQAEAQLEVQRASLSVKQATRYSDFKTKFIN